MILCSSNLPRDEDESGSQLKVGRDLECVTSTAWSLEPGKYVAVTQEDQNTALSMPVDGGLSGFQLESIANGTRLKQPPPQFSRIGWSWDRKWQDGLTV